ncbi:MAG TPA: DUF1330 domain-containing protein [Chryseosolibacter sp.]
MIYLTQLIFVKEGKESVFQQFEEFVLPLMEKYSGKLIYRLRPTANSFISGEKERPYEIHFVSFDSEKDFENYMRDDSRVKFLHLKDESVKASWIVKGVKI